jgi:hypothetical protein
MSEDLGDVLDKIKEDQIIELKNKGNEFYKKGDYATALEYYNKALEIDPEYLDALNNKGLALVKLGRIDEAKVCHALMDSKKDELTTIPQPQIVTQPEVTIIRKHERENPPEEKSGFVAVICSFFIPGLGQTYNGELAKGLGFLIVTLFFIGILGIGIKSGWGILLGLIFWIVNIYDAFSTARKMNKGWIIFKSTKSSHMILFIILFFVIACLFAIITVAMIAVSVLGSSPSSTLSSSSPGTNNLKLNNGITTPIQTPPQVQTTAYITNLPTTPAQIVSNNNLQNTKTSSPRFKWGDIIQGTVQTSGYYYPQKVNFIVINENAEDSGHYILHRLYDCSNPQAIILNVADIDQYFVKIGNQNPDTVCLGLPMNPAIPTTPVYYVVPPTPIYYY